MQGHPAHVTSTASAALASIVAFLVAAAPTASGGYDASIGGFTSGADSLILTFPPGGGTQLGPQLTLPSNGTVTAATIEVAGLPGLASDAFLETSDADFASNRSSSHVRAAPGSLTLAAGSSFLRLNASQIYSTGTISPTSAAPNGTALHLNGSALQLNGVDVGTILSDNITAPEFGWGVFQASGTRAGPSWTTTGLWFQLYHPSGVYITDISPGAVVPLDARLYPTLRVQITLDTDSLEFTPSFHWLSFGQRAGQVGIASAVGPALTNIVRYPDARTPLGLSADRLSPTPDPRHLDRFSAGPMFAVQPSTFFSNWITHLDVIELPDGTYRAYFTGMAQPSCCSGQQIGYATSSDLANWSISTTPLLSPTASAWDSVAVNQPTVLADPSGSGYLMYYSGSDGTTWRIGRATSPDGLTWTKDPSNPVLNTSATGWDSRWVLETARVSYSSGLYTMYYTGHSATTGGQLGRATSTDGRNWTKFSGNPVVPLGIPSTKDDAGAGDGTIVEVDSNLYYLYTCADGVTVQTCLAYIWPGGNSWVKLPGFKLQGLTGWEGGNAYAPGAIVTQGKIVVFYSGSGGGYAQMGRADAHLQEGLVRAKIDFGSNLPVALDSLNVDIVRPAGSYLNVTIQSSSDNVNWSPAENMTVATAITSTPPARYVRWEVKFNASATQPVPHLGDLWLNYSVLALSGRYESSAFLAGDPVISAEVSANVSGGAGIVTWHISEDGGASWLSAALGQPVTLALGSPAVHYAFEIQGSTNLAPRVDDVTLSVVREGLPADVQVRIGSGAPFFNQSGPLSSPVNVSLPVGELNALIAAAGASPLSPVPVDVALSVSSSHYGRVELSQPRVNLHFLYPLDVEFRPSGASLSVLENETLSFLVVAQSVPPSVPVSVIWSVDGADQSTSANFDYAPGFFDAGTHTVRCAVTNGDSTAEQVWVVTVADVDRPLQVRSMTPASPASFSHGGSLTLSADIFDPDQGAIVYSWVVGSSGRPDTGNSTTLSGLPPGTVAVALTASHGSDSVTVTWAVMVTDAQPTATASPIQPVEMSHTARTTFAVVAADPDGDPLSFVWTLDGDTLPTTASSHELVEPATGTHLLSVRIIGGAKSTVVSWNITATNEVPTVGSRAPSEASVTLASGAGLTLSVTASDSDGDATTYAWFVDGTRQASTNGTLNLSPGMAPGAHTVRVTITDSEGGVAETTWAVTVEAAPPPTSTPALTMAAGLLAVGAAALALGATRRRRA